MAKQSRQSKPQKETMERVMHEYKQGELTTGTGQTVKDHRQAIAIGLSESGSSDQQSPSENKKRLAQTRSREKRDQASQRTDPGAPTKADLYQEAKKRNVAGRSKMSKAELQQAVSN